MVSLTDLPTETLDNIVTQLLHIYLRHSFPRNCLFDLSVTSRRLNRITNPILYQSVYYRSYDGEAPAGPGEESHEALYIPPTRIFHLGYFSRTLESSEALRALILHVDIAWSKKVFTLFTERRIVHVLRLLDGPARFVHLGPPDPSFSVSSFHSLTSLSLTYSESLQVFDAQELASLHRICLVPTLRRLSLSDWCFWNLEAAEDESRSRTSNVTHLSVLRSGYPGPSLREILTWPKALESFVFQAYPYEIFYSAEYRRYSPEELLDYLRPQQESLQSVFLVINSNKWEANSIHNGDGSAMRDFSEFHKLKRLCVSRELLGFPNGNGFPRPAFEIRVELPPQIEQFQVDIQFSGSWEQLQFMDERLQEPLALGVFGVLDCLQHTVANAAVATPQLKRIVVYYGTYSKERRLVSEDKAIPSRQLERAMLLRNASAAAGVEIIFWTNWRRPLWKDWLSPQGLR